MVSLMDVDSPCKRERPKTEAEENGKRYEIFLHVCCGTFEPRNILGIVIISPLLRPHTRGTRLLQGGRPLPRHASLEGFLQATSRLFGCHWDCLKRICLSAVYSRGAGIREKGRQITISIWHHCYAFVNIKDNRWGSLSSDWQLAAPCHHKNDYTSDLYCHILDDHRVYQINHRSAQFAYYSYVYQTSWHWNLIYKKLNTI